MRGYNAVGSAYGIPRKEVNGMDLGAVRQGLAEAIDRARTEKRPALIEAETYRYRGHSMSDPGKYRTKESLEEEKARDPIPRLAAVLVERGFATTEQIETIDKDIKAELKEVLKNAESAPWPDESLIDRYVYASPVR